MVVCVSSVTRYLVQLLDDVNMRKDKIYDDYYHAAMRIDELKKVSRVDPLSPIHIITGGNSYMWYTLLIYYMHFGQYTSPTQWRPGHQKMVGSRSHSKYRV